MEIDSYKFSGIYYYNWPEELFYLQAEFDISPVYQVSLKNYFTELFGYSLNRMEACYAEALCHGI